MEPADRADEKSPAIIRDSILPAATYKPPRTAAERRIAQVWIAALHLDRIGIEDDFFEIGGESMTATVICAELQRVTGRRVDPGLLNRAPTIADFVGAIEGDLRDDAARSLIEIRSGGERPPLVLVHGIDGQIMFVRRLAWLMPPEQPIYGIQARGMDGSVPPHRDHNSLIEDYADQIAAALRGRAIHLGGFCLGAALAVGVAHRLRERGIECRGLILIDPPVEPRARKTDASRSRLMREWHDTLAERIAPFTRWHPELAAHYAPGGEGLRQAMAVMAALTGGSTTYVGEAIDLPATVIWSQERAGMRGGHMEPYALIKGPCRSYVVHSAQGFVTHARLLQQTLRGVAGLIREAIGLPPLDPRRPGPPQATRRVPRQQATDRPDR